MKKPGRPKKTTKPIELELLPAQHAWLECLVAQACHGTSKEMILLSWINDRFRQMLDSNLLQPVAIASNSTPSDEKIVQLDHSKNPPFNPEAKANHQTKP